MSEAKRTTLIDEAEALVEVTRALEGLSDEGQVRVLLSVTILYGMDDVADHLLTLVRDRYPSGKDTASSSPPQ